LDAPQGKSSDSQAMEEMRDNLQESVMAEENHQQQY
jgi:hypothetical protein